jgi:hypothetical protein
MIWQGRCHCLRDRQIWFASLRLFQNVNLDLEDCYNLYYAKAYGIKAKHLRHLTESWKRSLIKNRCYDNYEVYSFLFAGGGSG